MDSTFAPVANAIVIGTVQDAFDGEYIPEANQALTEALITAKLQKVNRAESLENISNLLVNFYDATPKRAHELADGLLIVCGVS